ncbi:CheY-like chemotaxis protein [Flavobacteriaceae bacterium MAR_2010_72]|nr:CheY-like chemotaxis protein [Flavobacteriaceae bacterium MAR_2010_72]TVZ57983.1 CheY-like chemotaxis protein [Flavobacteriaceae bacterium MAR_2010_105]
MIEPKKIILVDDNKIDLFVNQKIIELFDPDIQIKAFTKATSALCYLKILEFNKDFKSVFIPDAIVLDINMPEMDGFEFLCELEQLEIVKNNSIAVYMLSSSSYPEDMVKAKKHNLCSGYFNKPLTKAMLVNMLSYENSGFSLGNY